MTNYDKEPCGCSCHTDGVSIFCSCFVPCCDNDNAKYRDENGTLDEERFEASRRKLRRRARRVKEMRDGARRPGKCECGRRWNKRGLCPECDKGEK
jgi:hypothetical protein